MWATQEQYKKAKQLDLLTYLRECEPNNLKKVCNGTYCTREHDSLRINDGKWYWFSRNIGGYNALDYLIKVKGFSFSSALETIIGVSEGVQLSFETPNTKIEPKRLEIPTLCLDIENVRMYLKKRGISDSVIEFCNENGLLFEGKKYHDCIFLGYDGDKPKYGAIRSTTSNFKGDLSGSDKQFSFRILADESNTVHVFEAAIDLLSYATLEKRANRDWKRDNLISLAGVYKMDNKQDIPLALKNYLNSHHNTKTIYLHFDNDEVGRTAAVQLAEMLSEKYEVIDSPPKSGKDYNDYLMNEIKKEKELER